MRKILLNKKFLCVTLIILGANLSYANMKEDIAFLNELYKQEKYEAAEDESKKFIVKYPESKYNKNICERLAKLYFIEKDYKESEKYFLSYLTEYKLKKREKQEAYAYLYKINMVLGNKTKALEYSEGFVKNKTLYEDTLYDSGVSLLNNGKNVDSIKEFQKVIKLNGKNYPNAVLYLGMGLYNNGQYEDTIKYLDLYKGLEVESKNLPLLTYLYGSTYYKLNNLNKGIEYFETGIAKYPNSSYTEKGKVSLIEIYVNRREIDKALLIYSEINNESTKRFGAKVLGDYFLSRDEYKRALSFYKTLGKNMGDGERYTYAYANYKLGDYKKAEKEFKKIREEKYIGDTRYYLALSAYNMKDYKNVLNYEKYLDNYKDDPLKYKDLQVIFGSSAYELHENEKAYKYYNDMYNENPTLPNLYRKIVLEGELKDGKNLDISFLKYKNNFISDEKYRKNIYTAVGNYYYENGRQDEAVNVYKEYMEKDKDTDIGNNLITILVNEKRYNEVVEYIDMLSLTDDNTYLKGVAYMGMGEYEKANETLVNLKDKEGLDLGLREKVCFNIIKNNFLWEKYKNVIEEGEAYLKSSYFFGLTEIVDRMGLSYYRLGNYPKARETFKKLELIEESKDYARFQIAETYFAEKKYREAKKEYELSYKNNKKYEEEGRYWGLNCDLNLGEYKLYMSESRGFLKDYPNSSYRENVIARRGEILTGSGDNEAAIEEYRSLYEKTKDVAVRDSVVEKIIALYSYKDQDEQRNQWIEKFSDKYKKSYYKSAYYREKGMKEEAQKEEKILLESPSYKDYAIINAAEDDLAAGKFDEAEKNYAKIREMDSSLYKDVATFRIGELSYRKKDYENSIRDFSKLTMLYPDSVYVIPAKLKMADVYYETKDMEKAEEGYKNLLNEKRAEIYKMYIIEKLLVLSLERDNKEESERYYNNLKSLDKERAKKYDEFFLTTSNDNKKEAE